MHKHPTHSIPAYPLPLPSLRHRFMWLLAAPPVTKNVGAAETIAAGEWPEALRLGERWKVLPALAARLACDAGQVLPSREADELRRLTGGQFIRTSLCLRAGSEAMQQLRAAGIQAAAFKGAAVIALRVQDPLEPQMVNAHIF